MFVVWACLLTLSVAITNTARAYCRETIDAQPTGPCVEKPGAALLHWTRSCLTQTFNDQFWARMSLETESEIRSAFKQSFQTWADVNCANQRAPFMVDQASGTTTTAKSEFVFDAPNQAIIVAKSLSEWVALEHDPQALALTLLWHDADSGEILDVDMELNAGSVRFANCDKPCGAGMIDLRNTITHEAGHLLGLGHSPIVGTTMFDSAPDGQTEKRTLAKDDIQGYCALKLPEFSCADSKCVCPPAPVYPRKRSTSAWSCTTAGAGAHAAPAWLLLGLSCAAFGLWLALARARRVKSRLMTERGARNERGAVPESHSVI